MLAGWLCCVVCVWFYVACEMLHANQTAKMRKTTDSEWQNWQSPAGAEYVCGFSGGLVSGSFFVGKSE